MAGVAVVAAVVIGVSSLRGTDADAEKVPVAVATGTPAPSTPSGAPTPMDAVTPAPDASGSAAASAALAALAALPTNDPWSDVDYDRDLFRWREDVDRNGCDTRNDILGRDLQNPVFKPGTNDCKVLSGTLIDPYDGRAVPFQNTYGTAGGVEIDHVVALAWAWRHGADTWTEDRLVAFANDPRNLLATSVASNQSKSDSGPVDWLPAVPALRCAYVERFVSVLTDYGLGIDDAERTAARDALGAC